MTSGLLSAQLYRERSRHVRTLKLFNEAKEETNRIYDKLLTLLLTSEFSDCSVSDCAQSDGDELGCSCSGKAPSYSDPKSTAPILQTISSQDADAAIESTTKTAAPQSEANNTLLPCQQIDNVEGALPDNNLDDRSIEPQTPLTIVSEQSVVSEPPVTSVKLEVPLEVKEEIDGQLVRLIEIGHRSDLLSLIHEPCHCAECSASAEANIAVTVNETSSLPQVVTILEEEDEEQMDHRSTETTLPTDSYETSGNKVTDIEITELQQSEISHRDNVSSNGMPLLASNVLNEARDDVAVPEASDDSIFDQNSVKSIPVPNASDELMSTQRQSPERALPAAESELVTENNHFVAQEVFVSPISSNVDTAVTTEPSLKKQIKRKNTSSDERLNSSETESKQEESNKTKKPRLEEGKSARSSDNDSRSTRKRSPISYRNHCPTESKSDRQVQSKNTSSNDSTSKTSNTTNAPVQRRSSNQPTQPPEKPKQCKRSRCRSRRKINGSNHQSSSLVRDQTTRERVKASVDKEEQQPSRTIPTERFKEIKRIHLCCQICDEKFERISALEDHKYRRHHIRPIQCLHLGCNDSFHKRSDLFNHLNQCHPGVEEWECKHCGQGHSSETGLREHMYLRHQKGTFACTFPDCGHRASYRADVLQHYRREHDKGANGNKTAIATNDSTTTTTHSSLDSLFTEKRRSFTAGNIANGNGINASPMLNNNNDKQPMNGRSNNTNNSKLNGLDKYTTAGVKCSMWNCVGYFYSLAAMREHLWRVHARKPVLCIFQGCQASFAEISHMEDHIRSAHPSTKRWFCTERGKDGTCYFSTQVPAEMTHHQFMYHQEGRFRCIIGGCGFEDKHRVAVVRHFDRAH